MDSAMRWLHDEWSRASAEKGKDMNYFEIRKLIIGSGR